ncbi:MAG: hypothetical protein EOO43_15425 [Flavobacterium sp.]|nr:MAG: hypothetical protein EOO43_15425 [Flavobacterium sp.]
MINQIIPEAFFDSLSLAHKLDNFLDGFRLEEIHLFSYFASILFLYRQNPVSDWQYRFTISSTGYPFSDAINDATSRHIQNGLFEEKGTFYSISSRGTDEFNKFKILPTFKRREEFLTPACTTSIIVPYSDTLRALLSDPEISKVKALANSSWLEQTNIYQKFDEISKAVGVSAQDLVIPAVTWINYINEHETLESK